MLTIKPDPERSSTYIESKRSIKSKKINELDENDLIENINKIKQENEKIRRENLLFARYLTRINTSTIVETYDEYVDENNLIHEILDQTKSSESPRRYSLKKTSNTTKKGWTKVSINFNEHLYTPDIQIIEKERLSIAAYEIEQTRLEWERMKTNAFLTLDDLDILYRTTESDEISQETLNRQLEKRVEEYRVDVGDEEFYSPYLTVPAELVVSKINKRINSRVSVIGLLRINSTRLFFRIEDINAKIRGLDDLTDKVDEIDMDLIHTRSIDTTETFQKLDRKYKLKKSSQYPLFRRLQEWKKFLNEQENEINDMKYKCELLQNHFERTIIEIDAIKQECQSISKENHLLKNRIDDVMKVPAISDYAHIIEQTKVLQHGIHIWTKRVNVAETLLSQLKRQQKPASILPPLKPTAIEQHRSMNSFNEYANLSRSCKLFEH